MKVGVFPFRGKVRYNAYTVWYDPRWRGCCEHHVLNGINGTAAKKLAIQEHIQKCGPARDRELLKAIGE